MQIRFELFSVVLGASKCMLFLDKLVVLSLTEKEENIESLQWFIYRRINKYDIYARTFLSLRYIREENDWITSRGRGRKKEGTWNYYTSANTKGLIIYDAMLLIYVGL